MLNRSFLREACDCLEALSAHRGAQDAETAHDPSNGQFTSGQHAEAANYHKNKQTEHETEAEKRGETSTSPYGTNGNAASHHQSASFYHNKASENSGSYAALAHKASKLANQASKKVASLKGKPVASKHQEEKPIMTPRQHQAKRIARYLAENRIKMR